MTSPRCLALLALGTTLGCAHAEDRRLADLMQAVKPLAVDWDDPRMALAAQALRAQGGSQAELQARAPQVLATHGLANGQLAAAYVDDAAGLQGELKSLLPARCGSAGPAPELVLCARMSLDFEKLPTVAALGTAPEISGRLLGSAELGEALLLTPDGAVKPLKTRLQGRAFDVRLPALGKPGSWGVELMVTTPRGAAVAALWTIDVTKSGEPTPNPEPPPVDRLDPNDGPVSQAARHYFDSLNEDRSFGGFKAMAWSETLARAATERAVQLARTGELTHLGEEQLKGLRDDAGHGFSWVAENLVRARSVGGARRAILRSPSHRRNDFSPYAEVAGIGAAWVGSGATRTLLVVSLLARGFDQSDPDLLLRELLERVNGSRRGVMVRPLALDSGLCTAAQRYAGQLARQPRFPDPDVAEVNFTRATLIERPDLTQAQAALYRMERLDGLKLPKPILSTAYNVVGLGVARQGSSAPWNVVIVVATLDTSGMNSVNDGERQEPELDRPERPTVDGEDLP